MTRETKKYYTEIAEEYAENQSFEALPEKAEKFPNAKANIELVGAAATLITEKFREK